MADFTVIPNTSLEPKAPARSIDALALRDNPIAIAEGAPGAPRIQNAAFLNDTLGAEKFKEGNTERSWVLARTSEAFSGFVGTYKALQNTSSDPINANELVSGSTLRGTNNPFTTLKSTLSGDQPGTWRAINACKGAESISQSSETRRYSSLFLRIA